MIRFDRLSKTYEVNGQQFQVLDEISLEVPPGQIMGVIGRSGAGKSTLLRCVNGLVRPSSGTVQVDGKDMTRMDAHQLRAMRQQMGMVFQQFNLLGSRTVFDNVALPLRLAGQSARACANKVVRCLQSVGLQDRSQAYPHQLSGGQKQRVAIARALVTEPRFLLCDEMTSALDPETTESIVTCVRDSAQAMGLTVFLITHEMEVIKALADRVAVIDQGRIVECNDVASLFKQPNHSVTRALVSANAYQLPRGLAEQLHSDYVSGDSRVVQLVFSGVSSAEPVVDAWIKQHDMRVNILQAQLEVLRGETLGVMVCAVRCEDWVWQRARAYMAGQNGVALRECGYVS